MDVCRTCRFWDRSEFSQTQGDCRAHPPVVLLTEDRIIEYWPTTKAEDWCGEWQE